MNQIRDYRVWIPMLAIGLMLLLTALPAEAQCENCGFMDDYVADLERVSEKLVSLAEAIPAEQYSWRPNDEVRPTSGIFMHVAGVNFLVPVGLGAEAAEGMELGENPFALLGKLEAEVTAKDDVIGKLKSSIEYAKGAVREVAATGLSEQSELFGFAASKRAYLLIVLTHSHEHLGQAIAYARSMGVTPPWSQQGDGGDEG